jgi:drug/metabolite transporter (DMT)-like permease
MFFDSFKVDDSIYIFGAVYIGLFEMGITFVLWLKGLSLSKNRANTSTLVFLSPFLSLIFIAVILGEELYISSLVGLILIICGILIQQLRKKRTQLNTNV